MPEFHRDRIVRLAVVLVGIVAWMAFLIWTAGALT